MKCLIVLPFCAMLVFGAPAQDLDWSKYDPILLGKDGKAQEPAPVEEGSGFEPTSVAGAPQIINNSVVEKEPEIEKCDNGWIRYDNSCYFIERTEKATIKNSEKECHDKKSTLLVIDSKEEYDSVMAHAPANDFIWTGLFQKTDKALWQAPTEFDYKNLNWLITPYSAASNGWSTYAQCAAFYSGPAKYTYFYPCDWKFLYVCERNSAFAYSPDMKF